MSTHVQIVNSALILLGERTVASLSGSENILSFVNELYDNCWRDLLGKFPWHSALRQSAFTGVEVEDGPRAYSFAKPDHLAGIKDITDAAGNSIKSNCLFIGTEVMTDYDEGFVYYISTEGIIPVSSVADPSAYVAPYMETCVSLLLAYGLAFKTSQNVDLVDSLYQRYLNEVSNSIRRELQITGAGRRRNASWDVRGAYGDG